MKKIFIAALLIVLALPIIGQNQDEYKFSLVPRRVAVPSLTGYLKDDGTVPLTADYDVGEFNLTAKNLTAHTTFGSELITFATFGSGTNWAYASSKWTHTAGSAVALTSTWTPTIGVQYKLVYSVTGCWLGGNEGVQLAVAGEAYNNILVDGTYTHYFTAKTAAAITFTTISAATISITACSVMVVTDGEVSANKVTTTNGFLTHDGTASRPGYAFSNYPGTGIFTYGGYLELCVEEAGVGYNNITIMRNMIYLVPITLQYAVNIYAEADGGLALRGYTNTPAALNIYGTRTSATDYERGFLRTTAAAVEVGSEKGSGGGTARPVKFYTDGVDRVQIDTVGAMTGQMINNADSDTDEVDSVTWAGGYGMVIAASVTDSKTAVWRLEGTTLVAISVNAAFTATKDNASTYNVYFEGGAIKLQNKVGDNKAVKLGFYGI
jgi:hypothetical protein